MKKFQNIYLVDDDEIFHFITLKALESANLIKNIKAFYNGYEAIQYIESVITKQEELPDVILLDLSMPVMDGWQFLEEYISLKPKLGKKITIYIVSSSIDPADMQKAATITEITDFIIKPVTKEKLINMIKGL